MMAGNPQGNTPLPKISAPATRALASIGVTTIEQLAKHTEKELLALHGFGPKAIQILRPVMDEKGVSFRDG
jgi:predicted RecB family nuclease